MEMSHQQRHTKAGQGIGLGWFINPAGDGEVLSHGGATGGYNAFAGFNKTTGQAVVVLTNSDAGIGDIGMHLMDPDAPLRPIAPHVARELRRILDEDGVAGLDQKYEKLRKEKADFYDFSEDEINTLGYYYLGLDNVDAALAIFKINTIEHPGSFNVWDSYAEGLKESGDTALSIIYYQKSLELNPGNTNGIKMLADMGVEAKVMQVEVPAEVLESYVGSYELAPGFVITITREDTQLHAQATGQPRFELYASAEDRFYLTVVDAQVKFNFNTDGSVKSLTLFQGGQEIEGMRMEE
jgi:tetratricopeptide (TPR) repeat protein